MSNHPWFALVLSVATAMTACAQTMPRAERAATPQIASHPRSPDDRPEAARAFDFLLGSWRINNRILAERLSGSDDWVETTALVDVVPILGGYGNIDRYRATRAGEPYEGMTVRLFDPASGQWTIHWIDSLSHRVTPQVGGTMNAEGGIFYGEESFEGQARKMRFRWSHDGPDRARWDQAYETDEGEWEVNWIMTLARRDPADEQYAVPQKEDSAPAPIALQVFEDADRWDVYAPGDLALANDTLGDLRVLYSGELWTPAGPVDRTVSMEVRNTFAAGREADWIQWIIADTEAEGSGYPNLDLLIVDRATGQLRYRMFPSGPTREQGGPYSFIHVSENSLDEMTVPVDGAVQSDEVPLDGTPVFDFGALGFVLPFIELSDGSRLIDADPGFGIRLRNYNYSTVGSVAVAVGGAVSVRLQSGATVRARDVDVLLPGGTQLITYRLSQEAPYFLGWDYKRVADGVSLFRMAYVGHVEVGLEP